MAVALVALGERRFREHGGPRLLISWDDSRPFSTFMFYDKTKKKQFVVTKHISHHHIQALEIVWTYNLHAILMFGIKLL